MNFSRSIEWLIETDSNEVADIVVKTNRISFPYALNIGRGYTEQIDLLDDIKIIKQVHCFTDGVRPERIPLGIFNVKFPSTTFVAGVTHSGKFDGYSHDNKIHFTGIPFEHIFGLTDSYRLEQSVYTHEDLLLTMVFIPDATLTKLVGTDVKQQLYEQLGIDSTAPLKTIKFPQSLAQIVETCAPDHLTGALRALYAQSAVLQYLLKLQQYVSSNFSFHNELQSKSNFNIKDVYEELISVPGYIPDLSSLAGKFNVTSEKIKYEFSKAYGQSIFSFVSAQRLYQANLALKQTNIPMKVLADKIGYSHVNHFITAYKKKYGVTPGAARKNRVDFAQM